VAGLGALVGFVGGCLCAGWEIAASDVGEEEVD